jgi:iron complex transport system permease protein
VGALQLGLLAGVATGAEGLSLAGLWRDFAEGQAGLIVGEIRLPRSLGAALVGGLLGLGGGIAQGVFRNPLADPFLLGSASGAGLGVVLVLAATVGAASSWAAPGWLVDAGAVLAAFVGACGGVMLTLALARGAAHTLRLLLAGVVVGAMLGAAADLLTVVVPDALRGRQAFALGSTSLLGWSAVLGLGLGLALLLALARRHARALDALTLGEDTAGSLGLPVNRLRLQLVALLAAATALAVSQAGLVAFVGLVAPHLVRRRAPGRHGWLLPASSAMGAMLLLWADVGARAVMAPAELPLGIVTAVLGGLYLCALLLRQRAA